MRDLTILLGCLAALFWAGLAGAAQSAAERTDALSARLVSAEDGVAAGRSTVSAGLAIELAEGWKIYWRSPGEVGLAPRIDWQGSDNVAEAEMLWPAPTRFRAFGIENYGYENAVTFPLRIRLEEAGAAARLAARVELLACSTICVPQELTLTLALPGGTGGIDAGSAARIAEAAEQVPQPATRAGLTGLAAGLTPDRAALVVALESDRPLGSPELFPETAAGTAFGAPEIRLSRGGRALWARLPVTSPDPPGGPLSLTVTDGDRAGSFAPVDLAAAPPAPYQAVRAGAGALDLLWIAGLALIGGLILNAMPCVLPVLSIKLASAVKAQGQDRAAVRTGFLLSALGVLAFMWTLAGATLALRAAGVSVGWGLQFQNPVFLAAMIAVLGLFTANLAGLFEIRLPASWTTALDRAETRSGRLGDFLTGAFAAVLATPCSAPFLGTAIAFALAGRAVDVGVVFTALGLGLALPYLAVAARPGLVARLPRPGRWMLVLKLVLALLLGLTAGWLFWVLAGVSGWPAALAVGAALALGIGVIATGARIPAAARGVALAAALVAALAAPLVIAPPAREAVAGDGAISWTRFDSAAIPRIVARGEVVFVDVTADWCLTCKANKALVIDRDPVAGALDDAGVTAMQADWTRPDPAISRYLARHDRYAIPFNIVYGPGAPEGIVLPELLSAEAVMQALTRAGAADIAAGEG